MEAKTLDVKRVLPTDVFDKFSLGDLLGCDVDRENLNRYAIILRGSMPQLTQKGE